MCVRVGKGMDQAAWLAHLACRLDCLDAERDGRDVLRAGRQPCVRTAHLQPLASGLVTARRLSQAIAEGDGISLLVEIRDGDAARAAEEHGAEGLVVRVAEAAVHTETGLPLLAYGVAPDAAAAGGADAVVLTADEGDEALEEHVERCRALGIECVVRVRDDEELARALDYVDPEILLLSAERAEAAQAPLDRLLELLPDVPAGKLAIAELPGASREDVEELERAGVDAVLVSGDIEALVGDAVPDV